MSHRRHHLTPLDAADRFGLDADELERLCREESIPILHGRVDVTLFEQALRERRRHGEAPEPVTNPAL